MLFLDQLDKFSGTNEQSLLYFPPPGDLNLIDCCAMPLKCQLYLGKMLRGARESERGPQY